MFGSNKEKPIDVLSATELANTAESLLTCINYGLFPKTLKKRLNANTTINKKHLVINAFLIGVGFKNIIASQFF